jgi:hypothetical protein
VNDGSHSITFPSKHVTNLRFQHHWSVKCRDKLSRFRLQGRTSGLKHYESNNGSGIIPYNGADTSVYMHTYARSISYIGLDNRYYKQHHNFGKLAHERLRLSEGDDSRAKGFQLERKPRFALFVSACCDWEGTLGISHFSQILMPITYGSSDMAAIAWLINS